MPCSPSHCSSAWWFRSRPADATGSRRALAREPPPTSPPGACACRPLGIVSGALGCPAILTPAAPRRSSRTTAMAHGRRSSPCRRRLRLPRGGLQRRRARLGQGGDPNGADIPLSVPGDATGVYFRYDTLTGEIVAEPVANAATLVTDLGEQFAMAPPRRWVRGDLGRPAGKLRVPGPLQWPARRPGQRESGQSQPGHRGGRRGRRGHGEGHAA